MKVRDGTLWRKLRRVIFQTSHLTPYLTLLGQTPQQKRIRVHDDLCYPHQQQTSTYRKSFLQRLLFNRRPCLYPCSNLLLMWYLLVFLAIMYYFVEGGLVLTYGDDAWQDQLNNGGVIFFNVFFMLVFVGDAFVQLNCGFLNRGMMVMDKQRAVGRYLRYFLLIDTLLVLVLFLSMATGNFWLNYGKLLILVKLIRMFEIDGLYLRRLGVHRLRKTLYVIGKQVITIFNLSHACGLIFYLIDFALVNQPLCQNNPELCWLYSSTAYSPILNYDWQVRYFYTLYWGVNNITTISYGDIGPNNPYEVVYAVPMMCFGFIVYGYVVNSIIKVVLWARALSDQLEAEKANLESYMQGLDIKVAQQAKVIDYLQFLHTEEKNRNLELQEEMKAKLPDQLRYELVRSAYAKVAEGLQFILEAGNSVTRLLFYIQQRKYTANETIISQDNLLDSLHMLHKGEIRLSCHFGESDNFLTRITSIDDFLLLHEFFLNERIAYSMIAEKGSVMYLIDREKIEEEAVRDGQLKQRLRFVEYDIRIRKNFKRIFYECYFCHQSHCWQTCPEHFPTFQALQHVVHARPDAPRPRPSSLSHNTWKHRHRLNDLIRFRKMLEDQTLGKMQKRLKKIREKLQQERQLFEVDTAHDWQSYLPQENLSRLKELWNNKNQERRISLFSAFGGLLQKHQ